MWWIVLLVFFYGLVFAGFSLYASRRGGWWIGLPVAAIGIAGVVLTLMAVE